MRFTRAPISQWSECRGFVLLRHYKERSTWLRISPIVERALHMFYLAGSRRPDARLFVLQPAACSGSRLQSHISSLLMDGAALVKCVSLCPAFRGNSRRRCYHPSKLPLWRGYLRFFFISQKASVSSPFYSFLTWDFSDPAFCLWAWQEEHSAGCVWTHFYV